MAVPTLTGIRQLPGHLFVCVERRTMHNANALPLPAQCIDRHFSDTRLRKSMEYRQLQRRALEMPFVATAFGCLLWRHDLRLNYAYYETTAYSTESVVVWSLSARSPPIGGMGPGETLAMKT